MPFDKIIDIRTFYLEIEKPPTPHMGRVPYVNENGYIVDFDNGTIYPAHDRTVVVKITCESGLIGWGETYGITAPRVVAELVRDVIRPCLIGQDPCDVRNIWTRLYNLMRVRGYVTGFWLDAIAAVDIGLWDLCGKIFKAPVSKLLGGADATSIPYYITSLAGVTAAEKLASALKLYAQGERAFKVHAASSFDFVKLIADMRERMGDAELMLDLHWNYTSAEALAIAKKVEPYDVLFIEAPCQYEDIDGLARVARGTSIAIAGGEEWRTVYDAKPRLSNGALSVLQPEMGRTGITQFTKICDLADLYHARVMPHATIGFGIFMAASVHASIAAQNLTRHELQNTMFPKYLHLFDTQLAAEGGAYKIGDQPGLGIEPNQAFFKHAVEI